jgi:hypothetical protein
VAQLVAEKTRERLLEEEDVKRALRKLKRLTQEEVQIVLIQNMEVVYCLINNIMGVIDGTQNPPK